MDTFYIEIDKLQPSQLYINRDKLDKVNEFLDKTNIKDIEPIPIKKIGDKTFFTDGHTRACALYNRGINRIKVYWDNDDEDWIAYLRYIDWCINDGINTIKDLKDRVVNNKDYKENWLNRCKKMHEEIEGNLKKSIDIKRILSSGEKSKICDNILHSLPEWFGIEESIKEYVDGVKDTLFITANIGDIPVGFISILTHNQYTSEIYVMGILREFHRIGIGRMFVEAVEQELRNQKTKFLTVKTLSSAHPDEYYKKTRKFYKAAGFLPIEEFKTLWGEANPCLMLIKALDK